MQPLPKSPSDGSQAPSTCDSFRFTPQQELFRGGENQAVYGKMKTVQIQHFESDRTLCNYSQRCGAIIHAESYFTYCI